MLRLPGPAAALAALGLLVPLGLLGGCDGLTALRRQPAPAAGVGPENRRDPSLSGDGRFLATVVERGGRATVLLQERSSGRVLPLRQLQPLTPHRSPSLSWNGRYLALLGQRGPRRLPLIVDRVTGRIHALMLPGDREPQRLSLAPDGRRLAVQMIQAGQMRVQLFDLGALLEPDLPAGQPLQGGGPGGAA